MKSYLRFLSRNKLYTAIEVVGLSLALAFVIVLSSYIVKDLSVNKVLKNTNDIYLCHNIDMPECYPETFELYDKMPEIDSHCNYLPRRVKTLFGNTTRATYGNTETEVCVHAATENFFDFFTFPLTAGIQENLLAARNSVVISEKLAAELFPDTDPIGKEINVFESNSFKEQDQSMTDFNVNFIVTGVFKPFSNTIFIEPDMIIRLDLLIEANESMSKGVYNEFLVSSFIKLHKGTDTESLRERMNKELHRIATRYAQSIKLDVTLTPFAQIRNQESNKFTSSFENLKNCRLFNIYLLMCIFITIISLLDYIVLTIAFSRFRIKEIATRQILGTERKGVITRCFGEALILLVASCIIAVLLAIALKEPTGEILGAEINPLTHLNEYIILATIIIVMVALASAVPSFILSSYNAINIIKGEARYRDKMTFAKAFIGFAGFLSIGALSICLAVTKQTRHIINQPLGYQYDNLVCVEYIDGMDLIFEDIKSQSFVEEIGIYDNLPCGYSITGLHDDSGKMERARFLGGTEEYIRMLGIRIIEDFNVASVNPEDGKWYMCASTYENCPQYMKGENIRFYRPKPLCGIVNDFKLGPITADSKGKITLLNISDFDEAIFWGQGIVFKSRINENLAANKTRELLKGLGFAEGTFFAFPMRTYVESEIKEEKNMLKLLTGFSLISLLMTIMTIVGLSSYHSKINEKDNAVRNIFGCPRKELVRNLVLTFVLPIIVSALAAIPIAYTVIGHWLEDYVIRIDNSPVIYLGALAAVLLITIAAVSLQALRLMRTNPAEALKKE